MNNDNAIHILFSLLLALLSLSGCRAADVPETLAATSQWVAFTYVDTGDMRDSPLKAQEPLRNQPSETELRDAVDDVQIEVILREGSVYVYGDGTQVWRSDPSWDVQQMLLADLDNDHQQEVAFVLWKPFALWPRLLYDEFRFQPPYQEGSLRNHLFLYGWRDGKWRALWCSSPIADPIRELGIGDVDADGFNELVVLEGSYDDHLDELAYHATLWRWNGWGFTLDWRSPLGRYRNLILHDVTGDQVPEIVVQDES